MSSYIDNDKIRSIYIQKIINNPPRLIIRWGILLVFIVFIALAILLWFIEYPTTISTKATITTSTPIHEIYQSQYGFIGELHVQNGQIVQPDELIILQNDSIEIRAHFRGCIIFSQEWQDSQIVKKEQLLLKVIPINTPKIAVLKIHKNYRKKILIDQKVRIRFSRFDHETNRIIEGKITSITNTAKDDDYIAYVNLPNSSIPNINKSIQYLDEITGNAVIEVKKTRLLFLPFTKNKND